MMARAVRIDVSRVRLGQVLIFVCMVAVPLARRFMIGPMLAGVGGLLLVTLIVFVSARRSFGQVALDMGGGRLRLGVDGPQLARADVTAWTIDGASARVYTREAGWRFTTSAENADVLRRLLAGAFGGPLILKRRGSRRARAIAGIVALAGIPLTATGIALQIPLLAAAGVPAVIFGLAALGALSQKVR